MKDQVKMICIRKSDISVSPLAKRDGSKYQGGFTLIELLITMVVFVFAIAAASQIFTNLLTQFKQQSKIAETNIEGIVGLNLLRQDIEHAGLGLPWNVDENSVADTNADNNFWDNVPGYNESPITGAVPDPAIYNDAPNNAPSAFRSGNGDGAGGSDYLVIKSASVSSDRAAGKNTRLSSTFPYVRTWSLHSDDLYNSDRSIVISPGSTESNSRSLLVNGGSYHTSYSTVSAYAPAEDTDVRLVYGISDANPANSLRAPFNRSDYYISTDNVSPRCAVGTGVLIKATLNHNTADANVFNETPLLDCVADMQVVYRNDTGVSHNDLSTLTDTDGDGIIEAHEIRDQLREIRVYILAHEGQKDSNFIFNNFTAEACDTCIRVGSTAVFGRDFDFAVSGITDYLNYRWKVFTLSVNTDNLR